MLQATERNLDIMTDAVKKDSSNITKEKMLKIESRFGDLEIDTAKAIYFPKGIYGFKEDLHFAICDFPQQDLKEFKILQCLNDHSVSFPVILSGYDNQFIEDVDMKECLNTIEVEKENFLMLFIANSRKSPDGSFSVNMNLKAPIVMDVSLQIGIQYIFTNNKYSTSHPVS